MARKSKDLDKKMLRAGALLLRQKGAAALSIRNVAKKTGVNLGMFNYYFDGKDDFIRSILEEVYAPFIQELKGNSNLPNNLEETLFRMAVFSRDHHLAILSLLGDVLSEEKNVIKFLEKNFTAHFAILHKVLSKHFKIKSYDKIHLDHAFRFLISTAGMPNLLVGLQIKLNKLKSRKLKILDSDELLRRRVRAAVDSLDILCRQ